MQLFFNDLNGIKALLRIGSTVNDTFLSMPVSTAADSAGNAVIPIPSDAAFQATVLTPDDTRPELLSFVLDLNQATLELMFVESINPTSIDSSGITLQNAPSDANASVSIQLTSGVLATTEPSEVIEIGILDTDFTFITSFENFSTATNNTFLAVIATAFQDTSGNRLVPILRSNALIATRVISDNTPPMLRGFDFSLDQETLTLTFSEAVDVLSLEPTQLTIQVSIPCVYVPKLSCKPRRPF